MAFLCPNQTSFVLAKWAIWLSGHAAVPLNAEWADLTLEHAVRDSNAKMIVAHESLVDSVHGLSKRTGARLMCLDKTWTEKPKEEIDADERQKFIYGQEFFEADKRKQALILYGRERGN